MTTFNKIQKTSLIFLLVLMVALCSSCSGATSEKENGGNGPTGAGVSEEQAAEDQPANAGSSLSADDQSVADSHETGDQVKDAESLGDADKGIADSAGAGGAVTDPKTPGEAEGSAKSAEGSATQEMSVLISIQSDDGSYILPEMTAVYEEGDTVLSILIQVGKDQEIPVVFSGLKKAAYIQGIDNLFEFDKGSESGWIYKVNGEAPLKSCGAYPVSDGDEIRWIYITSLEEAM